MHARSTLETAITCQERERERERERESARARDRECKGFHPERGGAGGALVTTRERESVSDHA